jgi:hypothetical protein
MPTLRQMIDAELARRERDAEDNGQAFRLISDDKQGTTDVEWP